MDLKLGLKLPPIIDDRTIPLSSILRLKLLPELPLSYNIDYALGGIHDDFVFNNSLYGDCVIAARAHQTLRFEKFEQGVQIPITDKEVVDQYFIETGGPDVGLYLLNSLKSWRKDGWPVGDYIYTIYAFASVDWKNHDEVKHCIHLLGGVNFGMKIYQTDMNQFSAGEDWTLTGNDGSLKGGHGVYAFCFFDAIGYELNGVTVMTWGKRQKMTWDFWDKRVSECYGIVDNRNHWMGDDSPVDVKLLDSYLKEITGDEPSGCLCPFLTFLRKVFK